jgi:hypothetical protein
VPTTIKLYFDIAVGLLIAGLVVFAGWQYDQRKLDADKLDKLGTAMSAQTAVLAQLQAGQQASDAAVVAVAASQAAATQHGSAVRQRVVTMGNSNATIQHWLDTPLPVGGCMLDDTCANGGVAGATIGSSASAVH